MDCVLLAGGVPQPGQPLYPLTRGQPKALLEIAGRPMAQWVLDALAQAEGIGRVVMVGLGDGAPLSYPKGLELLPSRGLLVDNLYSGIDRLLELDPMVELAAYCWSDIPLISGAMVDRFLGTAVPTVDVVGGLVARPQLEARFPEVREDWLRFREGEFVAADFGVFRPRMAAPARRHLEALAPQRKNALRQARTVGLGLLLAYLLRRLTVRGLEDRIDRRYAIRARIQVVADPELGLDVDGPINLEICQRALGS